MLFHVTADTTWSNLPLSGLFVDMLRRIVALAGAAPARRQAAPSGAAPSAGERCAARARSTASACSGRRRRRPSRSRADFAGVGDATHPPGFYGPPDALVAVNALGAGETLAPRRLCGRLTSTQARSQVAPPVDLRPWLLGGGSRRLARRRARLALAGGGALRCAARARSPLALAIALLGCAALPRPRRDAAGLRRRSPSATWMRRCRPALAYVVTGDARSTRPAALGLTALSRVLAAAHLAVARRAGRRSIPRATNSPSIR